MVARIFGDEVLNVRHLDYGGGNGVLSAALFAEGFDSQSYDPFVDGALPADIGKFNLVTAFEVFEHVPDVNALVTTLGSLVDAQALVLFTTLTCDGQLARGQRLTWWYASPRNGHISLYSRKSLELLGAKAGFRLASASPLLHVFWRELPPWAEPLIGEPLLK
jgi:2-polyprenyl-3-methyl-5-hydroxy-6-metoxy-1,4-benzoquinol methylase